MLGGYNNEIKYKSNIFHIQTEDGGLQNPKVSTQIFVRGSIVAQIEESYEALLAVKNLEQVVRKIMQEQHKNLIKKLIHDEFDQQVALILGANWKEAAAKPQPPAAPAAATTAAPANAPAAATASEQVQVIDLEDAKTAEKSLDELILESLGKK